MSKDHVVESERGGTNGRLATMTAREIAAIEASMDNHSKAVTQFGFGMMNIYSLFNAGAFAAIVSTIPTAFGQQAVKDSPLKCATVIFCFVFGFVFSTVAMISAFQYSHSKYRLYRDILRGRRGRFENDPVVGLHVAIVVFSLLTISCTFLGCWFAVDILRETRMK